MRLLSKKLGHLREDEVVKKYLGLDSTLKNDRMKQMDDEMMLPCNHKLVVILFERVFNRYARPYVHLSITHYLVMTLVESSVPSFPTFNPPPIWDCPVATAAAAAAPSRFLSSPAVVTPVAPAAALAMPSLLLPSKSCRCFSWFCSRQFLLLTVAESGGPGGRGGGSSEKVE